MGGIWFSPSHVVLTGCSVTIGKAETCTFIHKVNTQNRKHEILSYKVKAIQGQKESSTPALLPHQCSDSSPPLLPPCPLVPSSLLLRCVWPPWDNQVCDMFSCFSINEHLLTSPFSTLPLHSPHPDASQLVALLGWMCSLPCHHIGHVERVPDTSTAHRQWLQLGCRTAKVANTRVTAAKVTMPMGSGCSCCWGDYNWLRRWSWGDGGGSDGSCHEGTTMGDSGRGGTAIKTTSLACDWKGKRYQGEADNEPSSHYIGFTDGRSFCFEHYY